MAAGQRRHQTAGVSISQLVGQIGKVLEAPPDAVLLAVQSRCYLVRSERVAVLLRVIDTNAVYAACGLLWRGCQRRFLQRVPHDRVHPLQTSSGPL